MDYEDELDWMRNRKRRNAAGKKAANDRSRYVESDGRGDHSRSMERSSSRNHSRYTERSSNGNRSRYTERSSSQPYGSSEAYEDRRVDRSGNKKHVEKRKRKKKKKLLLMELSILAVLALAAFFLFGKSTGQKGYWTIAVFGVDSRNGNTKGGTESDVEMLCNINKATGEIKLVSVYRDSYLKIDNKGTYFKINEAYNKGGHKQAVAALDENLDLKIDDYATFNWKSVAQAINILGGVDIDISDAEFSYINGFITETVNSTGIGSYQLKKAGMNHLDGVQAVAYARLRLMDTDFKRTERQRKVLGLALQKAKEADPGTLKTLVATVFPQISTSIGINDLFTIASGIHKYHITETAGFPFSRTTMKIDRRDCVIPTTLESNVIRLHQFLYGDESYVPSAAVKAISAKLSKISGISEPGENAPTGDSSKGRKPKADPESRHATTAPKTEASKEETRETRENTETRETQKKPTQEPITQPADRTLEKETNLDGSLIGPGADIKKREPNPTVRDETTGFEPLAPKPEAAGNKNSNGQNQPEESDRIGPGIS